MLNHCLLTGWSESLALTSLAPTDRGFSGSEASQSHTGREVNVLQPLREAWYLCVCAHVGVCNHDCVSALPKCSTLSNELLTTSTRFPKQSGRRTRFPELSLGVVSLGASFFYWPSRGRKAIDATLQHDINWPEVSKTSQKNFRQ